MRGYGEMIGQDSSFLPTAKDKEYARSVTHALFGWHGRRRVDDDDGWEDGGGAAQLQSIHRLIHTALRGRTQPSVRIQSVRCWSSTAHQCTALWQTCQLPSHLHAPSIDALLWGRELYRLSAHVICKFTLVAVGEASAPALLGLRLILFV